MEGDADAIGRRVAVPNGRTACALGTVAVATRVFWEDGKWLGVIMDEPWMRTGFMVPTTGTAHGRRFFKCRPGLGVFVPEDMTLPEASALQYRGAAAEKAASRFQSLYRKHRSREGVIQEIRSLQAFPSEFKVGAKAILHLESSDEDCTIRYIGPTMLGRGVWAGVELALPNPTAGDGTAGKERLFSCVEGRGMYVRLAHITVKRERWALLSAAVTLTTAARIASWDAATAKPAIKSFSSVASKVAMASKFVKNTGAALPKSKRDVSWQDSAADRHASKAPMPAPTSATAGPTTSTKPSGSASDLTPAELKLCGKLRERMFRTRGNGSAAWKGVWSSVRDKEGESMVAELADMLRARGGTFRDPDFTPTDKSLFMDPSRPAKFHPEFLTDTNGKRVPIEWKRPSEFGDPTAVARVFSEGIDPDDIHQGILGDCYFLAAIAACAKRNMLVEDLVVEDHDDVGIYAVKFFREGAWVTVFIDELMPCYKQGSEWVPAFCRYGRDNPKEKETWCMIMEKAWAKLHGSYEACIAGDTIDALNYLTGGTTMNFLLPSDGADEEATNEAWEKATALEKRIPFMASEVRHSLSSEFAKTKGLISDHAYSVLALKDTRSDVRLVKCRNPWGEFEWSGDYSDNSRVWTADLKREVGYVNSDDGSFWMAFRDFAEHFENIGVCLPLPLGYNYASIRGSWTAESTAGGCAIETFQFNPTYSVECDEGPVVFTAAQQDIRGSETPFLDFRLFVFRNPTGPLKPSEAVLTVDCIRRTASAEFSVPKGRRKDRLVCVVAAWGAGVEGTFWLTVSSRSPIAVSQFVPTEVTSKDAQRMKAVDSRIPLCLVCNTPVEGVFLRVC
eukprot:Opistho-2@4440